jgi:23S rRNA (cytosine1962-C5)-methyltransferase
MLNVYLKKLRDKPVKNGHPWIFSGSIERIEGNGDPGVPCRVLSADGAVLAHGYYNKKSAITVRVLTRGDTPFTKDLLRQRIERAVAARRRLFESTDTDSFRLVNAEGDFLPGLIVEKYAAGICIQVLTAGMECRRDEILQSLSAVCKPDFIVERSDTESSGREGLLLRDGVVSGTLPQPLVIRENGISVCVDPEGGQKTGFYFDQRENRLLARSYAAGRRCCDCFSYTGGFTANLLAAGAASVTSVDSSKNAIDACRETVRLNGLDASRTVYLCADVFEYLRSLGEAPDLIILDPPKFAKHPGDVERASRGYKDINLVAMKKIAPGGILFTFSCSNAIDAKLFRQIVFAAAADAGRDVQVLHMLSAGVDHPVSLGHPEGEYLKGVGLKVL